MWVRCENLPSACMARETSPPDQRSRPTMGETFSLKTLLASFSASDGRQGVDMRSATCHS